MGGPPEGLGVVGTPSRRVRMPSRRSKSGRKALTEDREWTDGHLVGPGVVGMPSRRSGSGRKALSGGPDALPRSGRSRVAISESRYAHPVVREWLGVPPVVPGVVGRPSQRVGTPFRRSGSGREARPEVQERSGGPPEGPGVAVRPHRSSGNGREVLPVVRKWSCVPPVVPGVVGRPPKGLGVVGRPSRRSRRPSLWYGSGQEAIPVFREWS